MVAFVCITAGVGILAFIVWFNKNLQRSKRLRKMTEEHQLRVSFEDLKQISLECKHCGKEVTLDIA
jgi:hypothetical protein